MRVTNVKTKIVSLFQNSELAVPWKFRARMQEFLQGVDFKAVHIYREGNMFAYSMVGFGSYFPFTTG